ncbi:MAG: hypothetical protein P8173_03710 [Gammaproteobacteria bacterium]
MKVLIYLYKLNKGRLEPVVRTLQSANFVCNFCENQVVVCGRTDGACDMGEKGEGILGARLPQAGRRLIDLTSAAHPELEPY